MDQLSILIQKAKKGDKEAYGQIYNLFYSRIFRFCKFNCPNDHIAQDICQETFLKAWKSLPAFSTKGGSLQAYLFKIARNLTVDFWRKKKTLSLTDHEDIPTIDNLEEKVDKQSNIEKVRKVLFMLKEDERQIIILRYFEDLSQIEVAKAVGLREGNIRVKTHRILQKLRGLLETA